MVRRIQKNAVLVQTTKVDAVRWTASGDGLISGGVEVVLWKKSNKHWEIAWKFRADSPQTIISANWSIEEPLATAVHPSKHIEGSLMNEGNKCVLVCQIDTKLVYSKAVLHHPMPVSWIQWRPFTRRLSDKYTKNSMRHVLLTSCFDGTVRLWSEIDNGRAPKIGKETNDQKSLRRTFCVAAVIEINHALNGILGSDIFITWGMEIRGIFKTCEGADWFSCREFEHDEVGMCEWLVSFGPSMLVTFWAIHCLDDTLPLRLPRIKLWKKHELQGHEIGDFQRSDLSEVNGRLLLEKVILLRNRLSGAPSMCSSIHLLPCNSLVRSIIPINTSLSLDKSTPESFSSHSAAGILNLDGHSGKIIGACVHPCAEVELAASVDSNGLLIFWSLSAISSCIQDHPALMPPWELCGKLATQNSCSKYTCLGWAPSVLDDQLVLLMGHARGIDCFIVKICQSEEERIECHYLCTVPFSGYGPYEDGPTNIFVIPSRSTCNKTFYYNKFMLLGIWMEGFQALSWDITLHSLDLSVSSCQCNFDVKNIAQSSMWTFQSTFSGKNYCVTVNPCSSQMPEPHSNNQVTSCSVVVPGSLICKEQNLVSITDMCSYDPIYMMATGCSDGSLKLWRSNLGNPSALNLPWELVGMFVAHESPINAIALTGCGRKVATVCNKIHLDSVSSICIWQSAKLIGGGTFLLEDTLSLDKEVVSVNWLALGNGLFLLGICLQNELRVYAQRRSGGQTLLNSGNYFKMDNWGCIAVAHASGPICDFFWGPRAMAVIMQGRYFSICSHHASHLDKKQQPDDKITAIFADNGMGNFEDLSTEDSSGYGVYVHQKNDYLSSHVSLKRNKMKYDFGPKIGLCSILEIAERLSMTMPLYHTELLLMNIGSGNWKRAYMAVRHFVECITSKNAPRKRCLTNSDLPEILLSNYMEGLSPETSTEKAFQWSGDSSLITSSQSQIGFLQFSYVSGASAANNKLMSSSTRLELNGFVESIEKLPELSVLSKGEKTQILAIMDLLGEVSTPNSSAYQSLDELGRRFWVSLRFQQLHFHRKFGRAASVEDLLVDSRLIAWAYHCDCQEIFFGSVIPSEPSWEEMRNLGIGFWFTNVPQLRSRMEKQARLQYLKNKNPKDCALLYVALNRVQVLAGLCKISKDEKDKPLVGFLSRNFQEEKNKAAALKNAYVLLGKHQLELAVAFFLLGGDNMSAINVCAKTLGDEQLALVICRLVEGHGGPLACHLIKKYILPSAVDNGNYWLASLLEWELGNYYQSFLSMLNFSTDVIGKNALKSSHAPFLDPYIGFYCQILATKSKMRNAVGESSASTISRWATLITACALNKCGFVLEAMQCFSSSLTMIGNAEATSDATNKRTLPEILDPSPGNSSNWLSSDVAANLEFRAKSDLALQYISKLMREHPCWPGNIARSLGDNTYSEESVSQHEELLKNFEYKLYSALTLFEQRFSLAPSFLLNMISLFLHHHGLLFLMGYGMSHGYAQRDQSQNTSHTAESFLLCQAGKKALLKTTEEISIFLSRFTSVCSVACSYQCTQFLHDGLPFKSISKLLDAWQFHFKSLLHLLQSLRATLRAISGFSNEDLITKPFALLDLSECCIYFSAAWLQRNSRFLLLTMQPLLIAYTDHEAILANLKKQFPKISDLVTQIPSVDGLKVSEGTQDKQGRDIKHLVLDEERWKILGACLWQHMCKFMIHELNMVSNAQDDGYFSGSFRRRYFARVAASVNLDSNAIDLPKLIRLVSLSLCGLLKCTLVHLSSYHVKQLASFLWHKLENNSSTRAIEWLNDFSQSKAKSSCEVQNQNGVSLDMMDNKDDLMVSEVLWEACADPKIICDGFAQEKIDWAIFSHYVPTKGWISTYRELFEAHDTDEPVINDFDNSASFNRGSPVEGHFWSGHTSGSSHQKTFSTKISPFHSPREVYKRNGDLFEALCINSIDHSQAALASNRKGIIFFRWEDEMPFSDKSGYIWSEADWPHNGWAGCESIPAPTFVSPGVGLGKKKGAHLGLGGATVGLVSLTSLNRNLTCHGASGIAGAGFAASGLGWEIQQDFEEFVDPRATVENISTRALSSHPFLPFFLVGSSNTHIYLWEFGREEATATYGVLPAANVPPPYALASISALQFDHCGHRFASAALDGTVCTWQLEVGGRSNICPTESSPCFDSHASDVTYFSSSGSIIAVAGYNSDGVNVVIWDTLAPSSTSRASIICHEGGARSLSVFDHDVGSGSVSPLIVTGGKGGDVGVHDFRYIATGRTKRHKHADNSERHKTSMNSDRDQNVNGMLWYIPKAHLGTVTKISTIPGTSLFLTGSKDGDVKLWDAKRANLVCHWSKLHERHTFLQPSSRGFGGLARVAVTDIQVVSHGFLSCGGDGTVKLVELNDYRHDGDI